MLNGDRGIDSDARALQVVVAEPEPNQGLEPIASSVRCAPASGNGSCLALGHYKGGHVSSEHIRTPERVLILGCTAYIAPQ